MCQSKAYAGGDNENLVMTSPCMCVRACVCVSINTHLLIVALSNFKNAIKIKAYIPCSLYSESDDISAHDNFQKVNKIFLPIVI